jgi:hypothetical protein
MALPIACLSLVAFTAPSMAERRAPPGPCGSADDSIPTGLVVVLPPGGRRGETADVRALKNSFIRGVAVQVDWRDVEPTQGRPDWSKLDQIFASAESAGRWVHLLVFPGFFSPAWALEGVESDSFPIQYGPDHGRDERLPMPWDRTYLNRWFAFLKELAARFGQSPAFRLVAAAGPTSVSAEMTLPVKPPDIAKWRRHGYTPRKYLDAWDRVLHTYADTFPNQCVSLSGPALPILEQDKVVGPAEHARAREEIIDSANRVLGRRLAIQWSDLHAGRALAEAPDMTQTLISYNGRLITGLQMRSGAEGGGSTVMGAEGNPPLALRRSIDKGMAPNVNGRRINYLEIYEADVLADEMQPVLQYAASLFK